MWARVRIVPGQYLNKVVVEQTSYKHMPNWTTVYSEAYEGKRSLLESVDRANVFLNELIKRGVVNRFDQNY